MESSPTILYKYFGPDRVDVLANGLIRYSPLGAFNDPFEGQPEVTALSTVSDTRDTLNELIPQQAKDAYGKLPDEIRAVIPYELWEKKLFEEMKLQEPNILNFMQEFAPITQNLMTQKFNELLGVLGFSEVPDSLLMWSHYGVSHSGFVLAFDAKDKYFHEEKGPEDEFRHLRRVMYRDARPSATLVELNGVDIFLVKSIHWSYEREWRIIRPLSDAETVHSGNPFNVHLFRYPPSSLHAVIIGARASDQTIQSIYSAIRENKSLSHVRLKRPRPDSSHFLLRITDEAI